MNTPAIQISFCFLYDGTNNAVNIDTRKDPVIYQVPVNGVLHPQFSNTAVSVTDVTITTGRTSNISGSSVPTTATMSGSTLQVTIPSGLMAGPLTVFATLVYNN